MADPVRLKVPFETPEALIAEVSRSVGRGGVRLETKRGLPVGTRFIFELYARGLNRSVDVFGTVLSATETPHGQFLLHIRYDPPMVRDGLELMLAKILAHSKTTGRRSNARVPLQVRAVEERGGSPVYRLRDISMGGLGLDVEGDRIPPYIAVGMRFLFRMKLRGGQLQVGGTVNWVAQHMSIDRPAIGVLFDELTGKDEQLMEGLLSLSALPSPPWIARVAFGDEAAP